MLMQLAAQRHELSHAALSDAGDAAVDIHAA
jgi:hypothetical protein